MTIAFARVAMLALVAFVGCRMDERSRATNRASTDGDLLTIYVAASLADVAQALADSFRVDRNVPVPRLSIASSSVLARQIAGGAPADVFISADPSWVIWLDSLSVADFIARPRASNRLAVFVRAQASYGAPTDLPALGRIVVGDPSHVPVGVYARQTLECLGLWESVLPGIVPAADARAALQLFRLGAADAAIGYRSDAGFGGTVASVHTMPDECDPGIAYAAASIRGASFPDLARDFVAFLSDDDQLPVWSQFGFEAIP